MPSPDQEFADAQARIQRGDIAGADAICRRIVQSQPTYLPALRLLGLIAAHQNILPEAIQWMERATKLAPQDAALQAQFGQLLLQQPNRVADGVNALQVAVKLAPTAAALSDLGHGLLTLNRVEEADAAIRSALKLDPNFAIAYCNLGAVLRTQRKPVDAAESYSKAARLEPSLYVAHYYEGVSRAEAGDAKFAEAAFERALRLKPGAATQHEIGSALFAMSYPREAVPYLRQAFDSDPRSLKFAISLSAALLDAQQYAEAETIARKAVELDSSSANAHLNLASSFHLRDRYDDALPEYESALRLEPGMAQATAQLGDVLSQLGRDEEALALSYKALEQAPELLYVQGLMLQVLLRAQRPQDALVAAEGFAKDYPNSAEAITNLATVLYETGDTPRALNLLRQSLAMDPKRSDTRVGLSIALLSSGNLAEGWKEYAHRPRGARDPRFQPWDGSALNGKQVILRVEQGFGDNIQFIRYAELVAKRGGRAIVVCTPHLQRLLSTVPHVEAVVTSTDDPRCAKARVDALMMDLPGLFETTVETIPANVAYVSVPPPALIERRENLEMMIESRGESSKLRVGLVWAGNAAYGHNRKRSIPIEMFAPPLVAVDDVTFFSLQVNPIVQRDAVQMKDFGIVDLSPYLGDFGDTAAALTKLDLLISVDTGVAHLAGALARPVWVLLPHICDWRWLHDRDDTPWYPTMRLFRQPKLNDWPSAIANAAEAPTQSRDHTPEAMTDICVPIFVTSVDQARRDSALAAEAGADLVEFRIDHLDQVEDVIRLTDSSVLPCIVTCRPISEGGESELADADRLQLLDAARRGRARYTDVELQTLKSSPNPLPDSRYVVSVHDFAGRPARLSNLISEMNATNADAIKIAWMASSIRDNIEAFEILQTRQKPTIAVCMGEAGLISRLLAKKFGAFLTYASLRPSEVTPPGQPMIHDLKRLYRWDSINEKTKVFGVVGSPMAHSMSPAVHNAAFDAAGFDGVYMPMLVEPSYESFKAFMISFVEFAPLDLTGLSITIPHKENALRYLQESGAEIEPLAQTIGAVNTIRINRPISGGAKLRGFNTDHDAILDTLTCALALTRETLADLRFAIIGAGGVARTAVAALSNLGATVVIYNRTREKADVLAKEFEGKTGQVVAARLEKLCDSCCHVFINCTRVGMHPDTDASPLGDRLPNFTSDTLVFDTIYNPQETKLLKQAKAAGANTVGGAEMFLRQASAQFEIFTGESAPQSAMRDAFDSRLRTTAR